MALTPGTKLAEYEILALLGRGGMGEVYRARDTKLGREVAIKVLSEELRDADRVARFEREAKLLAALNHPNIATLYGFEKLEEETFLVMELVEGETLAERIARGPIAMSEAVALFRQIAHGLEAAHAKGIIHRDLKPANIKIAPDGTVKILDFGLAKVFAVEQDVAAQASQSPTLTRGSAIGAIMGTASYMSPEQSRGKPVDRRTDVWAFGCCLYESLTGHKAFDGETVADILSKILQVTPDWAAVPHPLRRLLQRTLEKDPAGRFRDIADVRLQLEDSVDGEASGDAAVSAKGHLTFILTAALSAAAGAFVLWLGTGSTDLSVKRFSVTLPAGDEFLVGGLEGPLLAISTDGSKIVYAGVRDGVEQLFLRRVDEPKARPIAGTEGGRMPFFSHDGERIGFFADRVLKTISLQGGPPTILGTGTLGGAWALDDSIVFATANGLSRVFSDGRAPEETTLDRSEDERAPGHRWPEILPDGRGMLFTIRDVDLTRFDIAWASREDLEPRIVVKNASYPQYLPTGHLVFLRDRTLFGALFDLKRLETTGSPVALVEDVGAGGAGEGYFDISGDGTLVYIVGQLKPESRLVLVDRTGENLLVGQRRRGSFAAPRFSPDGRRVVVSIEPQDESPDLWILDIARYRMTRMTSLGGTNGPEWTPDGEGIFFRSGGRLFHVSMTGGEPVQIPGTSRTIASVSSDGELILSSHWSAEGGFDVRARKLDALDDVSVLTSRFNEGFATLSPDDRFIAYASDETGRDEIYVRSFPDPGQKLKLSLDGGTAPAWSGDGREIFYRDGSKLMSVSFLGGRGGEPEVGNPTMLFDRALSGRRLSRRTRNYDVSPDGQSFVMIETEKSGNRKEIHVVLNWFEELRRLVPAQ